MFLALEIYTLFFALPFEATYSSENRTRSVCSKGMYGLCRHPGVLWFAGIFAGICIMIWTPQCVARSLFLVLLDVAYVVFQDVWTFPRTFSDYDRYKTEVPFLIPGFRSARRCGEKMEKEGK